MPQTISEKILSSHSGGPARAGETVICSVDLLLGTDGSGPMAIDYFEEMRGEQLSDSSRVFFSLDHYSPPTTDATRAFHVRIRDFATRYGATVFDVGEGISHQIAVERGLVRAGDLVIGADSHTVMCGALNCFAVGVGSSDLAAAMKTGKIWLRVPETVLVRFYGRRQSSVAAKDVALEIIARVGSDGADYKALESSGNLEGFSFDDRLVLSSLAVECGAKAAIFPHDEITSAYLQPGGDNRGTVVSADPGARYAGEVVIDLAALTPRVARPHAPVNVADIEDTAGVPVHMVFVGTCTGGRVQDVHEALDSFERAGGQVAPGVQLVVTPASVEVRRRLLDDGSLRRLETAGAIVTMPGCGACCGTSGVIPGDGMTVISTANRNFKARMGNATASIYLASPAVCGAAAATGRIPALRDLASDVRESP